MVTSSFKITSPSTSSSSARGVYLGRLSVFEMGMGNDFSILWATGEKRFVPLFLLLLGLPLAWFFWFRCEELAILETFDLVFGAFLVFAIFCFIFLVGFC